MHVRIAHSSVLVSPLITLQTGNWNCGRRRAPRMGNRRRLADEAMASCDERPANRSQESLNIGVAAHISAASKGGPRVASWWWDGPISGTSRRVSVSG